MASVGQVFPQRNLTSEKSLSLLGCFVGGALKEPLICTDGQTTGRARPLNKGCMCGLTDVFFPMACRSLTSFPSPSSFPSPLLLPTLLTWIGCVQLLQGKKMGAAALFRRRLSTLLLLLLATILLVRTSLAAHDPNPTEDGGGAGKEHDAGGGQARIRGLHRQMVETGRQVSTRYLILTFLSC